MAVDLLDRIVGGRRLRAVASQRAEGDFHPHRVPLEELERRQTTLIGRRFVMVDQCHGTDVLWGDHASAWPVAGPADVIVTFPDASTPLGVWAADCAPVVLFGERGTVVGAHAGWRGLAAGILDVAAHELLQRSESVAAAVVGPSIHAECYAFGNAELAAVAEGVGVDAATITSVTSDGRVALDVPAAVAAGLRRRGITPDVVGSCTGCDDRWFSHRARTDAERHVLVAWTEPARATVGP